MKSKNAILAATALAFALAGGGFAIGREAQKGITAADSSGSSSPMLAGSQN